MRVAWDNLEISLAPGDSIYIKESLGVIFVTGEVYNEGLIEFREGKDFRYYINAAGGINSDGDKKNIILEYPNGVVVPVNRFLSQKIVDGCKITVNRKEFSVSLMQLLLRIQHFLLFHPY